MASGKLDDFSCWSANTTSDIQHSHSRLDANAARQIMFMSVHGCLEGFSIGKSTKVKCLTPAIFVKVGRQVVVSVSVPRVSNLPSLVGGDVKKDGIILSCQARIINDSGLSNGFSLVFCLFVIPVLKVFNDGCFVCFVVFVDHGTKATLRI